MGDGRLPSLGADRRPTRLAPGEVAWLTVLPCAAVLTAAIVLLAPWLGRTLFPPPSARATFWPWWLAHDLVLPEPTEHAGYLIALTGPLLAAAVVLAGARRGWRSGRPQLRRAAILWTELLVVAFLVACLVAQRTFAYGKLYSYVHPTHEPYFSFATLGAALALTGLLVAGLAGRLPLRRAFAVLDRSPWSVAAGGVVLLLTATWLLTAVNVEATIADAHLGVRANMPVWLDETFALLDRQAPLVSFHAQYSQLWPYATAGAMSIFGASLGTFVAVMVAGTAAALLCVHAVIRRVVRRPLAALALYVPFISTSFFIELGRPGNRYGPSNLFNEFPMRYGGPYALAWLVARHVDGAWPRRRAVVFGVAGLVAINNVEFGLPALGATVAAILWTGGALTGRRVVRVLGELAAGLVLAFALVSLLTYAVVGALPHFGRLLEFSGLYGIDGFGMLPMPKLGLHLAIYATFAASIVVATVRAVEGDRGVLTGMLAWSGVFGLGAGSYFVGRSHPEVLIDVFSAWAFALVLLTVVVVDAIRARASRRPRPAELAVLAGLALAVCSAAQTPAPWTQVARIARTSPERPLRDVQTEQFVAAATRPGEPVAILSDLGHRIAYDIGRRNVAPYASLTSMPTFRQLADAVRQLRAAGGHLLFYDYNTTWDEAIAWFRHHGFHQVAVSPKTIVEMSDRGSR